VAEAYTFTGYATMGYPDYADLATGRMLVAQPGGSYGIRAIDGKMTVPPGDGRWAVSESFGDEYADAPPAPPPVPPVPPVPGG
jgi:hypothetical protein